MNGKINRNSDSYRKDNQKRNKTSQSKASPVEKKNLPANNSIDNSHEPTSHDLDKNNESNSDPKSSLSSNQLFFLLFGLITLLFGFIFNQFHLIPPSILQIAQGMGGFIMLGAIFGKQIGKFYADLVKNRYRKRIVLLAVITSTLLYIVLFPLFNGIHKNIQSNSSNGEMKNVILQQLKPDCGVLASGFLWTNSEVKTVSCNKYKTGVLIQQNSHSFPEMNLIDTKGLIHYPTTFSVDVFVQFLNPKDSDTWAGLLVQIPGENGLLDNYIVAANDLGEWEMQQLTSGLSIPFIIRGKFIGEGQPIPQTIELTVKMQAVRGIPNTIYNIISYVNQHQISDLSPDSKNTIDSSHGLISLRVAQADSETSSPALFSNFKLDILGGSS